MMNNLVKVDHLRKQKYLYIITTIMPHLWKRSICQTTIVSYYCCARISLKFISLELSFSNVSIMRLDLPLENSYCKLCVFYCNSYCLQRILLSAAWPHEMQHLLWPFAYDPPGRFAEVTQIWKSYYHWWLDGVLMICRCCEHYLLLLFPAPCCIEI